MTGHDRAREKSGLQEWRAGWPLPIVAALGMYVMPTHIYSMGVFIAPLQEAFGWSRSQAVSGLLIVSIMSVLIGPPIGLAVDRYGARRLAIPGLVLYCAAFAGQSLATFSPYRWWAIWAVLSVGAICIQPTVWTAAVASRFKEQRGLALAITMCGAGLGAAVTPALSGWLVSEFGWRAGYFALGMILILISMPPVWALFYDASDQRVLETRSQARADRSRLPGLPLRTALLSSRYVRLCLACLFAVTSVTSLMVHFVPMLTQSGIRLTTASLIAGLIGVASILGRLGVGLLLDRVNGALVGGVAFILPAAVGLLLLGFDGSPTYAMAIALLLGLAVGAEVDVMAYLTTRYFGLRHFGIMFAVMMAIQTIAVGIGPLIAAGIYDASHSYRLLLIAIIPASCMAALMIATLGRYPALEAPSRRVADPLDGTIDR